MTQQQGALFDLDGVLIDSETLYTDFWNNIGKKYKLPSPTFAHDIKGCTLTDILTRYFPDENTKRQLTLEIHNYEDNLVYPIFDGVIDYLKKLRANGVKTAIVTSSDAMKMEGLFKQHPDFATYFDAIINGSMVTKSKPDPEGYLKAAKAIGCDIKNCTVYEDSFQGLEAGRQSGARVIALATTNSSNSLAGLADRVISSFKELLIE